MTHLVYYNPELSGLTQKYEYFKKALPNARIKIARLSCGLWRMIIDFS